ncbi:MAG: NUDIX domain-containing protein, partial [Candidatus Heimdallarchaeota archaeon]
LEETGYLPNFIFETDFSYTIELDEKYKDTYPEGIEEIPEYVFIARVDQSDHPAIDPNEHDEWKWCSFNEALKLLHWEDNKKALIHCNNYLEEEF